MKRASINAGGRRIRVDIADGFFSRLRGLMFRKQMDDDYGLYIAPCNQIHTYNMRFAIDVVYMARDGSVVYIERNIPRGRVCKTQKAAYGVLELCSGAAERYNIKIDDKLTIKKDDGNEEKKR